MESTMKDVINNKIVPFLKEYFNKIYEGKENLTIDGVRAYNDQAEFVGGKVINACSYVVMNTDKDSSEYPSLLNKLSEIIKFQSTLLMETWGMLNCLNGLYRLKLAGSFDRVIDEQTLETLKREVDWRNFVDINDNLALINKPTNYYGVAFGVAKYRELLGWENEGYSTLLLEKLMKHIDDYSGDLSFMDETPGGGRFDRYSVLIPGEIAALLTATNMEIPEKLLKMLRKSAEIYLTLANESGHGFAYGRSIGAYGDTSALEVLSMAAYLGLLTDEEKEIAYGYNTKIVNKFFDFWIDKEMGSLNMWENGRRTDKYRNKNRILGENLSLCMQIINSFEHWSKAGFEDRSIIPNFKDMLSSLPAHSLHRFSQGEYDRAMAVIRDGNHVFSLPLISGAKPYYYKTPYLPIPNENMVLETGANTEHANLVPRITLDNNTELMPIVYTKKIEESKSENQYTITYHQDELCVLEGNVPQKYEGLKSKTTYSFTSGSITREDVFYPNRDIKAKEIYMEFAAFSEEPLLKDNKVVFNKGDVYEIEAQGFNECTVEKVEENPLYHTSHGALKYRVQWRRTNIAINEPVIFSWTLKYK